MTKLKPCPFCGGELEKKHTKYRTWDNITFEIDEYVHPDNDCFLNNNVEEFSLVSKEDFDVWNRRVDNVGNS